MFTRYLSNMALIVTATLGAIGIASAGGSPAAATTGGAIQATGTGMVGFRGAIDASITAHYPIILTKDFAGDGTITVPETTDRVSFLGFTVYFSAQDAHVSGTDVEIAVIGEQIQASATGTGVAHFKEGGDYTADGQLSQPWDADAGSAIAVGATQTSGAGVFAAHGAGVVAVRGAVEYRGGSPDGVLLVKDIAGNATIHVSGVSGQFLGFTAYVGASGAEVSGADVAVVVVGGDVNAMASGHGLAYVHGAGAYSRNRESSSPWTLGGRFADIAP